MIKLALTDLDDTLIPNGADGASPAAIAAIHDMLDAGLRFGPVSGRVPSAMGWMFHGDEACCATGAFVNGQVLRVDGRDVKTVWIDTDLLLRTRDLLDEANCGAFLAIYNIYEHESAALVTHHSDRLERYPDLKGFRKINHCIRDLDQPRYVKSNILCSMDYPDILDLRDRLNAEVEGLTFVMPSNHATIIDILPDGWDKGKAVLALAEELGIGQDEIATFGDSENDLPMLEAVPNSVAVANASDAAKAAARWHIGPSADDAVADALADIARAARAGEMPAFMRD